MKYRAEAPNGFRDVTELQLPTVRDELALRKDLGGDMGSEIAPRSGGQLEKPQAPQSGLVANLSTATTEFTARLWSPTDLPDVARLFGQREQIAAESVDRHSGFIRRIKGQPFELLTAWCADRDGVLLLELRRAVVADGNVFRSAGDWELHGQRDRIATQTPRRINGIVNADVVKQALRSEGRPSTSTTALQRVGEEASAYLPSSIRASMADHVRDPEVWSGRIVQHWATDAKNPTRQQVDVLRLNVNRGVAVRAHRSLSAGYSTPKAAADALAVTPWSAIQVDYEFSKQIDRG